MPLGVTSPPGTGKVREGRTPHAGAERRLSPDPGTKKAGNPCFRPA